MKKKRCGNPLGLDGTRPRRHLEGRLDRRTLPPHHRVGDLRDEIVEVDGGQDGELRQEFHHPRVASTRRVHDPHAEFVGRDHPGGDVLLRLLLDLALHPRGNRGRQVRFAQEVRNRDVQDMSLTSSRRSQYHMGPEFPRRI